MIPTNVKQNLMDFAKMASETWTQQELLEVMEYIQNPSSPVMTQEEAEYYYRCFKTVQKPQEGA